MSGQSSLKIVGIIPARSGSKGIPNKNIKSLAGRPLIYYSIQAGLESRLLNRLLVSTDSPEIADIAKGYGAEVPFIRPAELAQDDTPQLPVLQHAVVYLEETEHYKPDIIVALQPTSPLRRGEHIDAAIDMLIKTRADRVVSVCEAEHSPYWMRRVGADGRLIPILADSDTYTRRQDLPLVYRFNGAVYVETYLSVVTRTTQTNEIIRAFVMDRLGSIDIDTELDFKVAELQLLATTGASAS